MGTSYDQQIIELNSADRLYLYSDGVTEAMNPERDLFGTHRLLMQLDKGVSGSLTESIALLQTAVALWQEGSASRDDISILGMECL